MTSIRRLKSSIDSIILVCELGGEEGVRNISRSVTA